MVVRRRFGFDLRHRGHLCTMSDLCRCPISTPISISVDHFPCRFETLGIFADPSETHCIAPAHRIVWSSASPKSMLEWAAHRSEKKKKSTQLKQLFNGSLQHSAHLFVNRGDRNAPRHLSRRMCLLSMLIGNNQFIEWNFNHMFRILHYPVVFIAPREFMHGKTHGLSRVYLLLGRPWWSHFYLEVVWRGFQKENFCRSTSFCRVYLRTPTKHGIETTGTILWQRYRNWGSK